MEALFKQFMWTIFIAQRKYMTFLNQNELSEWLNKTMMSLSVTTAFQLFIQKNGQKEVIEKTWSLYQTTKKNS